MASDISVTINPSAQIGATINPSAQISATISEGIPKHATSHAPGASDSLSDYYVTGSVVRPSQTGSFITSGQTGFYTGVFYPYSSNPNGYVQGAVVRPSQTGQFVGTGSTGSFISVSGGSHGDILYRGPSSWVLLPAGTSGQFLKTNGSGANPVWASIP